MMTRDDLRVELLKYEGHASTVYQESHGHMPMVLLLGPDGGCVPCGFAMDLTVATPEGETARRAIRALCAMGAASGAEAVVFISEGWMVHPPPGADPRQWAAEFAEWRTTHRSFEDHPDRVEVLTLQGACPEGLVFQSFRLQRPGDAGAHATLVPLAELDGMTIRSRFVGDLVWGPSDRWGAFLEAIDALDA